MEPLHLIQLAYGHRKTIKQVFVWICIGVGSFAFLMYLIIMTLFTVIQGNGKVSDDIIQTGAPFTEFQSFSYKTIYGERWYDFVHPYIFPTLGVLTQGVIIDQGAVVGRKHIAWDIADHNHSQTEVKAFADGMVVAVKDNTLYNTTRRWQFCDTNDFGICWYEVAESADVQIGCGNEVDIQHAYSLRSQYCHLAAVNVRIGNSVTVGQVIGLQGSTGWATGKHLHFALWRDGQPIPPTYAFTQTSLSNWGEGN